MQLDFFALEDDIAILVEYLIDVESFRLFEAYSRTDHHIREFSAPEHWRQAKEDASGQLLLRGWSERFSTKPIFREIIHKSDIGGRRSCLEGVALFQIEEGCQEGEVLKPSRLSHWNEAGARQRSPWSDADIDAVDWNELRKASRRMQRHVRNIARAKVGSYWILPHAMDALLSGSIVVFASGSLVKANSEKVEKIR